MSNLGGMDRNRMLLPVQGCPSGNAKPIMPAFFKANAPLASPQINISAQVLKSGS